MVAYPVRVQQAAVAGAGSAQGMSDELIVRPVLLGNEDVTAAAAAAGAVDAAADMVTAAAATDAAADMVAAAVAAAAVAVDSADAAAHAAGEPASRPAHEVVALPHQLGCCKGRLAAPPL